MEENKLNQQEMNSLELIKKRMSANNEKLLLASKKLNKEREESFTKESLELIDTHSVQSKLVSTPADLYSFGNKFIVGFSVNKIKDVKTEISDVFNLYESNSSKEITQLNILDSFINEEAFLKEFESNYRYYKEIQFSQFIFMNNSVILVFNYGDFTDIKSYRWNILKDGSFLYQGIVPTDEVLDILKSKDKKWDIIEHKKIADKNIRLNKGVVLNYSNGAIYFKNQEDHIILKESLKERLQSYDDMAFFKNQVNDLTLIKIKPYGEKERAYIFDNINMTIVRCDSIIKEWVDLPESSGIIFSDGFYLKNGEFKKFDINENTENINFFKVINSPNGEDSLFIFYDIKENSYLLYPFNMVENKVDSPIKAIGYAVSDLGELLLLRNGSQNKKDHFVQFWKSAFCSEKEYRHLQSLKAESRISKIGNNEVVKAISRINAIISFVETKSVTKEVYQAIIKMIDGVLDDYHWLNMLSDLGIVQSLKDEKETAQLVMDEFKKVQELKLFAVKKYTDLKERAEEAFLQSKMKQGDIGYMMEMLVVLKKITGESSALKNERYIDLEKVDELFNESERNYISISNVIAGLLNNNKTYDDFNNKVDDLRKKIDNENNYKNIIKINEEIEGLSKNLELLNEEIGTLNFEDNNVLSDILEKVAKVFSSLNQLRSVGKNKESVLALEAAKGEFGSQSKLLEQSLNNALMKSTTLEKAEEEYAKILVGIQNMESNFSHLNNDEFNKIMEEQKEDIKSAFATHKKTLRNKLQEKVNSLEQAVEVSLKTIKNKADNTYTLGELSTLFLTDGIITRSNKMIEEISALGDVSKSEELKTAMLNIHKTAIKRIRDDSEIFENAGSIIKLGNFRFAVNKKPFEISLLKNNGKIYSHVETTKYYKAIDFEDEGNKIYDHWDYDVTSESHDLYRSEYLAYSILNDAKEAKNKLNQEMLSGVIERETYQSKSYTLLQLIQDYSAKLFKEGYIKGVHDVDAEKIIRKIFITYKNSSDVKFDAVEKSKALFLFHYLESIGREDIMQKLDKGLDLFNKISSNVLLNNADEELKEEIGFTFEYNLDVVEYLTKHIKNKVSISKEVDDAYKELIKGLSDFIDDFNKDFKEIKQNSDFNNCYKKLNDLKMLIKDFIKYKNLSLEMVDEIIVCYLRDKILGQKWDINENKLIITVDGLIGSHERINEKQVLTMTIENFNSRNKYHRDEILPLYEKVDKVRIELLEKEKEDINLKSFIARPLSSFVKSALISNSYFPKFGANFSKQIGETGDKKRTDTMGLLLLVSPPGYGKTTLVEYIVDKLGMLLVKINCPSIGHDITSLDPNEAGSLTAKKEIEKINFAFEMGDNVCLYLDDIQHTNPEFLQRFISLCDGTRTIDGVWENKSKTYNLRGRRFAVIMAGNPYTESGEVFKIPDMLANRADTYNLGEISSDDKEIFELSYIENSLTSNTVTSSLMDKSSKDIHLFLKQINGVHVENDEFENEYSDVEANEIRAMLGIMRRVQKTILRVNEQYIYSASQSDEYRVEPPFKLQGSYRNMGKIVEKLLPLMTNEEVDQIVIDHYQSESQTLTKSNEENLLKFKEIFGNITDDEKERWEFLKKEFLRGKRNAEQESIAGSLEKISSSIQQLAENKKLDEIMANIYEMSMGIKEMNDTKSSLLFMVGEKD